MTADSLQKRLRDFLEANGIETAIVVVRDPDSCQDICHMRGEKLWVIGALEAQKQEAMLTWVKPPPAQSEL